MAVLGTTTVDCPACDEPIDLPLVVVGERPTAFGNLEVSVTADRTAIVAHLATHAEAASQDQ